MKQLLLLMLSTVIFTAATAQDEGAIIKKERIDLNKSLYVMGGPAFTFGKNIGDYSKGVNFELGYLVRLNRVLSIGPSVSYSKFNYDPKITTAKSGAYVATGDPNGWSQTYFGDDSFTYDYGYVLNLQGGNLSMTSIGFTVKINFIPIKDNTKFSIYGFAKPFLTIASRKAVTGNADRYTYETYVDSDDNLNYNLGDDTWYPDGYSESWGPDTFTALKSTSVTTGGINLGPGVEYNPAKALSVFAQAAFGYTFPVNYVSTQSYEPTVASYVDDKFPIVKKGFPSVNISVGLAFNF